MSGPILLVTLAAVAVAVLVAALAGIVALVLGLRREARAAACRRELNAVTRTHDFVARLEADRLAHNIKLDKLYPVQGHGRPLVLKDPRR